MYAYGDFTDTDFEASTSDEESTGIAASYTAGGMTLGLVNNEKQMQRSSTADSEND